MNLIPPSIGTVYSSIPIAYLGLPKHVENSKYCSCDFGTAETRTKIMTNFRSNLQGEYSSLFTTKNRPVIVLRNNSDSNSSLVCPLFSLNEQKNQINKELIIKHDPKMAHTCIIYINNIPQDYLDFRFTNSVPNGILINMDLKHSDDIITSIISEYIVYIKNKLNIKV